MLIDSKTDVRIIALTSTALRIENAVSEKHIEDPEFLDRLKDDARRIRREINLLKLNQQTPGI